MKVIVTTNEYQASRNILFSERKTTATLYEDLTLQEARDILRSIAYDSSDNVIELLNGDIYSEDFGEVIYVLNEKTFQDDGYQWSIVANNYKLN
jgi:hypothetical protein